MLFASQSGLTLQAYSDADWGDCPDDCLSTGGYCIFLGKHLISWSSRKQSTVPRLSTKAEYKTIASLATKLIWLQTLMRELGIPLS